MALMLVVRKLDFKNLALQEDFLEEVALKAEPWWPALFVILPL